MPTRLTQEEQETHLSMTAADRSTWHIYSDDPVLIRKLERIGATLVSTAPDGLGHFFTLPASQVSLRSPKRALTPEQRAQLAERLRLARSGLSSVDSKKDGDAE